MSTKPRRAPRALGSQVNRRAPKKPLFTMVVPDTPANRALACRAAKGNGDAIDSLVDAVAEMMVAGIRGVVEGAAKKK